MYYHTKKGNDKHKNRIVDLCIIIEWVGVEEVTNTQVDPAVLVILVDKVSNDFMGPHFINMLYNLHILYILCFKYYIENT